MQLASRFASRSPVLRSERPLSDDQIRAVAPSIFADAPHESRSDRYSYIPTATVLQELRAIVPDVPSVAVQPLILRSQEDPGMFDFFNPRLRPSVLETHRYDTPAQLIADLSEKVIRLAESKVKELRPPQ